MEPTHKNIINMAAEGSTGGGAGTNNGNSTNNARQGVAQGAPNRNRRRGNGSQNTQQRSSQKTTKDLFKGKETEMNGHVFELPSETKNRGQFKDTLEALQIYASKHFKKDINHLEILFTNLDMPSLSKPVHPSQYTLSSGAERAGGDFEDIGELNPDVPTSGVTPQQQQVDQVDLDIYKEELKIYINDKQRLSATCRSLFNVIQGQASRLLVNKLHEDQSFAVWKREGNVAALLRRIKHISHQIEETSYVYDAIDDLQRQFLLYRQVPGEDNGVHLEK